MKIEQFVMAYKIDQDRVRALLPEGFESLRPVLRINAEIRAGKTVYIEFNTPVASQGKRGWLNIANWESPAECIKLIRDGQTAEFKTDFLTISYTATGIEGGCPAEKDNDGCFFGNEFRPKELISSNKKYCECSFRWNFTDHDAVGASSGEGSVPAFMTERKREYDRALLTVENAAKIPCEQVLGSYCVEFDRG